MSALVPTRRTNRWATLPNLDFDGFENRLFRMFGEPLLPAETLGWAPTVDVAETDDMLVLTAELPGMKLEDVTIEVEANVLTLRGEKKDEFEKENEKGDRKMRIWERRYGEFTRAFTLPNTVDIDAIDAEFENGVLKIHMPKTEAAKGRHIKIKAR
jgi:HSP20 family protein